MLETIMRLYQAAMLFDVRSPTPHLFGPPGCGKSTVAQQLADLLGVNLHVINVSRISPLELEGLQMPVDGNSRLELLTARYWTRLKEGDVVLFDEFLRGFPEVYNGLLDIFTSRQVGDFKLPEVFVMAASNSVVAYDAALEDRLLHLPVPDPRNNRVEFRKLTKLFVEAVGLMPEMAGSYEMDNLMSQQVLPTFNLLDSLEKKGTKVATINKGSSLRNLIGQALLRQVQSVELHELITVNNARAFGAKHPQFVLLLDGKTLSPAQRTLIMQLKRAQDKLTPIQRKNLSLNLQLIELADIKKEETEHAGPPAS